MMLAMPLETLMEDPDSDSLGFEGCLMRRRKEIVGVASLSELV
jgi:hypothetical protein